ncbi:hypothetical protein E2C01_095265 [Portunus trituberculatus]|uniref:Uncharacterized protein n=1 Tax=Portunus trituberculatus TaxID=210409 RepID=A0A5B7JYY9_PORTR|nr:hypothetical protein [Portunus trituberculatus]
MKTDNLSMFPTPMFTITGPYVAALTCDATQLLCCSGTLRTSKVLSHECLLGSCLSSSLSSPLPFHQRPVSHFIIILIAFR